jgi:hypothetical protein
MLEKLSKEKKLRRKGTSSSAFTYGRSRNHFRRSNGRFLLGAFLF